jgi:ferrous iron transport protein A
MVLLEAASGSLVRITGFSTGRGLEGKLRQLGLQPGDCARVVRIAPFEGPYLLEINGRQIAVGQGIASKILVEVTE